MGFFLFLFLYKLVSFLCFVEVKLFDWTIDISSYYDKQHFFLVDRQDKTKTVCVV